MRDIVYWKNVNRREELQRCVEEAVTKIGNMTGISCKVSI